jgi:hypothetical protein
MWTRRLGQRKLGGRGSEVVRILVREPGLKFRRSRAVTALDYISRGPRLHISPQPRHVPTETPGGQIHRASQPMAPSPPLPALPPTAAGSRAPQQGAAHARPQVRVGKEGKVNGLVCLGRRSPHPREGEDSVAWQPHPSSYPQTRTQICGLRGAGERRGGGAGGARRGELARSHRAKDVSVRWMLVAAGRRCQR